MTPSPIPQAAQARRNLVLKRHVRPGPARRARSTSTRRVEALPAPIDIKPPTVRTKAPYFTTWVRQQLVDRFGARQRVRGRAEGHDHARPRPPGRGRAGGQHSTSPTRRARRPRSWRSTTRPARCARWSAGATTRTRPFNLATQGQRQPGSSIKPFILAAALKQGIGAGLAVAVAQARLHRPGHQRQREVRRQQLREQLRGLADARRRPDLLRQLGLLGGRHHGRHEEDRARWPSGWASARRSPRTTR